MDTDQGTAHRRLALWMWIATAVVGLASAVLTVVGWGDFDLTDAPTNFVGTFAAMLYASLGPLIFRRVGNLIGWLLLAEGLLQAVVYLPSAYAIVGVLTNPGS